ncbi:DUF1579 family protein [Pontibacter sp. 172403-2]|uniref:DUF1579 family protein n=1 Tax=Pontibacter rufus TaxID=2791028 RepID=UPI0018AF5AF6|nr:DUF1579 family protein [Pontibacter sp. 172403-2]MBF9254008.1 DUF1579 family protein [Pontibacter sp. 172403-2]
MKKAVIFLLAVILLAGAAPTTQAQKNAKISVAEANAILQKMKGDWQVKTLIWQPDQKSFFESDGMVSYSTDDNKAVREQFDITQPDGSTKHYEGTLRYAEDKQRFEFVGLDDEGKASVMMQGKWDPRFSMLYFKPVKGQMRADGKKKLRQQLQYFFFDDGSLKKVTKIPDGKGNYLIAAEYHCKQQETVGL